MSIRPIFAFVLFAGCSQGGLPGPPDLGAADSAMADLAVADLAVADLAHFACGSSTCSARQMCTVPCCGGAGPLCDPAPDGGWKPGECGPGQQWGTCIDIGCGFEEGCYSPCVPDPPFCVDVPPGCDTSTVCGNKFDPKCKGLGGWMGEPCNLDGQRIVSHCN